MGMGRLDDNYIILGRPPILFFTYLFLILWRIRIRSILIVYGHGYEETSEFIRVAVAARVVSPGILLRPVGREGCGGVNQKRG